MLKPFRSWFSYIFKCFAASSSVDTWELGLERIRCVTPWEGHWDATERAEHGCAATGPARALAIPWKRDKAGRTAGTRVRTSTCV